MRIIKEKKNKGFTLVEVIVSMLVLSITIVSVLSAFTASAKSNNTTRKMQAAEALMEDVSEYVSAGGDRLGSESVRTYAVFGTAVTPTPDPTNPNPTVKEYTINEVSKGFHKFTIKITEDTNPTKYNADEMNSYDVFSFGGVGTNAALINACVSALSDVEDIIFEYYKTAHENEILTHNLAQDLLPPAERVMKTAKSDTVITAGISRELQLRTETNGTEMQVKMYACYELVDTSIEFPAASEKTREALIYESQKYDDPNGTGSNTLNQIYLLFSGSEKATATPDCEIRILDNASVLDCSMYIVRQETAATMTAAAELFKEENLKTRVGGDSATTKISFYESKGSVNTVLPRNLDLYCSEKIIGAIPTSVEKYENDLIAGNSDTRVVEIKIDIIDPETGAVLLTDSEVYLQ